jgi:hypothetical protein
MDMLYHEDAKPAGKHLLYLGHTFYRLSHCTKKMLRVFAECIIFLNVWLYAISVGSGLFFGCCLVFGKLFL